MENNCGHCCYETVIAKYLKNFQGFHRKHVSKFLNARFKMNLSLLYDQSRNNDCELCFGLQKLKQEGRINDQFLSDEAKYLKSCANKFDQSSIYLTKGFFLLSFLVGSLLAITSANQGACLPFIVRLVVGGFVVFFGILFTTHSLLLNRGKAAYLALANLMVSVIESEENAEGEEKN